MCARPNDAACTREAPRHTHRSNLGRRLQPRARVSRSQKICTTPCIVHQQTAPQRCAPAMLLEHCDTLVSSGLLRTSVGDPYYVRSARGRRPMLIAVPGAAPVERSAEQPSTTTEDAGAPLAKNAAPTTGHLVKSGHRSGSSICHRGAGCSLWAIRRTRIRLCVRLCSRSALGVRSAAR